MYESNAKLCLDNCSNSANARLRRVLGRAVGSILDRVTLHCLAMHPFAEKFQMTCMNNQVRTMHQRPRQHWCPTPARRTPRLACPATRVQGRARAQTPPNARSRQRRPPGRRTGSACTSTYFHKAPMPQAATKDIGASRVRKQWAQRPAISHLRQILPPVSSVYSVHHGIKYPLRTVAPTHKKGKQEHACSQDKLLLDKLGRGKCYTC